ncbi:MAG: HelD family protein [Thiohalorhabdus sp.]|uniref:HelD family protein n=1 Tax=Thiohalorhabdus sp. TaxID=3094134 RepID=UPI00398181D4
MTDPDAEPTAAELEERSHLAEVQARLRRALGALDERLDGYAREIREQKEYLWDSRGDMDHAEKVAAREQVQQSVRTGEAVQERRKRLQKLRRSPYFGRFDFVAAGAAEPEPVYIGIHHFHDDHDKTDVVHDWRAPIASLFYDYELGPARYESPTGQVAGEVRRKRQFRIADGEMQLMIESSVNVVDDVLQEELARASDDGMKNIVATIQRDQNAIIRDDQAGVLVIQGVAGSGKTSIALHRIAYLLYRFKDTLSSEDILIISPNRVFADYVSNVLPELGEEDVDEIGMEDLADELLGGQYRFQTFFEQTAELLEKDDDELKRRLRYKASPELLDQLGRYAAEVEENRFQAEDLWIARRLVPGWVLEEAFRKHRSLGTKERIKQVASEIEKRIGLEYNYDLLPEERKQLKEAVQGMVRQSTLRETYKAFFDWIGAPELFRPAKNGRLEYADVFPLIYLKLRLEGIRSPYRTIKHLLIDEMQDYTPVQYAVIARLFSCNMTILGDAHQSVSPYSSSNAEEIRNAFWSASRVTLNKSYRSSYEITRFAQRILPNPDLEAVERHGDEPEVIACRTRKAENGELCARAEQFLASDHNTLGVVCKTQRQAKQAHKTLTEAGLPAHLLSEQSRSFAPGVIVCTAHMAKGLEFDRVLVPQATADNYRTEMDRHLLYVACTRALHVLTLTHTGAPTPFAQNG